MRYICVDPVEFLYKDIYTYQSETSQIDILTPRGSYACAQIFLYEGEGSISVACEGWNPEIYEMVSIPVEANPIYDFGGTGEPHTPERVAPFEVYDCLRPCSGEVNFKDGVAAIYFSMRIPKDALVGITHGVVKVGDIDIPVTVEVSHAVVPEETLSVEMHYSREQICEFHNVNISTPEFEKLDTDYLMMMRRMRENVIALPLNPKIKKISENQYEFDFSEMEAFMEKATALGYTRFYHNFCGSGGMSCRSFEGYIYLAQYLTKLNQFLTDHEWLDKYLLSVFDEPKADGVNEYWALCAIIRKFVPGIKLVEAMNGYGMVEGCVDICIPITMAFDQHREEYEAYRKYDRELWYYDCLGPRNDGYINRFMDYALLATRYHGWANYSYNLDGYLHWAVNRYQQGQNPFLQSCGSENSTLMLPAGDTHIIYPGEGGPWMSVRLENYRAGFEEYEMLRAIASDNKELADAICASVFRSFKDVEYNPIAFRTVRNRLIRAMESRK